MLNPNEAPKLEDRLNDAIDAMIKNVRQGRRIALIKPLAKELIYTDPEKEEYPEEEEDP